MLAMVGKTWRAAAGLGWAAGIGGSVRPRVRCRRKLVNNTLAGPTPTTGPWPRPTWRSDLTPTRQLGVGRGVPEAADRAVGLFIPVVGLSVPVVGLVGLVDLAVNVVVEIVSVVEFEFRPRRTDADERADRHAETEPE